jgi:hypothetical protein
MARTMVASLFPASRLWSHRRILEEQTASVRWRVHRGFEETGIMYDTMIRPKDEAHVDFRAEMDCLVAVSACPESGRGQAVRVEIFDK